MSDVFTNQEVLVAHANARLNVHGRRLLVERVLGQGRPVAHVAKELGVSRQCAHRWITRFREAGEAGLADRSSRPRRSPRRTPLEVEQRVLQLRRAERRGQDWLGPELGIPARTVGAILRRHQVPLLCQCDPLTGEVIRASKVTALRYERPAPGDLVHADRALIVRGRPGRGSSPSPSRRCSTNRRRHLLTVCSSQPTCSATTLLSRPRAHPSTIFDRSANA